MDIGILLLLLLRGGPGDYPPPPPLPNCSKLDRAGAQGARAFATALLLLSRAIEATCQKRP